MEKTFSGYLEASTLQTTSWSPALRTATTVSCESKVRQQSAGTQLVGNVPASNQQKSLPASLPTSNARAHHSQRHGQHAIALVINVLSNQIDTTCGHDRGDALNHPAPPPRLENPTRVRIQLIQQPAITAPAPGDRVYASGDAPNRSTKADLMVS